MNSYFRVSTDFFYHPKAIKLTRRLGHEGVVALLKLWGHAARYRPDGVLSHMDTDDIEITTQWSGGPGELVQALVDLRFIDQDGDTYRLHDWQDHNPWGEQNKGKFFRSQK